eukprot:EG_transcript_9792
MARRSFASRPSWLSIPAGSDFPLANLPLGVFSTAGQPKRVGAALGDHVIDLAALGRLGYLEGTGVAPEALAADALNPLLCAAGKAGCRRLRERLTALFGAAGSALQAASEHHQQVLVPRAAATLHMPVVIGDYTDFYSSLQHAHNVGCMFRDPANALLPNWKHLPVAYHGRASSIVPSGVPIRRPKGQQKPNEAEPPVFGPCKLLDFELEMAFITFDGKPLGESISVAEAEDFIFGFVVFNDWSARDIQTWEYVPLGPFLSKNFASSISPWVVTLDALQPFRVPGPVQDPRPLPYLQCEGDRWFDIGLEVDIVPSSGQGRTVCRSNMKHLYWCAAQQLAHHTVNGCNMRAGDLLASGTISGPTPDSFGSMLELAWKGTKPLAMPDGTERRFLLDGDTVVMRAAAEKDGVRVGFGEVRTQILPAA